MAVFFPLGFLHVCTDITEFSTSLLIRDSLKRARIEMSHLSSYPATTVEAFAEDLEATPFCGSFHTCQYGWPNSKSAHFEWGTSTSKVN